MCNVFLEEDTFGSYARQLSKYFLAEGIVSGHAIFLASSEPDPSSILKVNKVIPRYNNNDNNNKLPS